MKFLNTLVFVASLASATPTRHSRALYFLDSDPQGASVVSFEVAKDGSLGEPQRTSTGGKGLIGITNNGTATVGELQQWQQGLERNTMLIVEFRSSVFTELNHCQR